MRIGGTAYILFREAKVYEEDGSQSTQLIAIKGFKSVTLEMDGSLPLREWEDIQKVRDIPHVIKGLGTLADVRGHHIQALILPYLPAHLGEYMIKLSSAENNSEERIQSLCLIFYHVAKAMHHMHLRGFYHNDLKPENILINYDIQGEKIVFSKGSG